MKYKNINSAIHNFGHSFVSDMNYIDDDFIINELKKIHRKEFDITIDWLTGDFQPEKEVTERLIRSIAYWRDGLEKHLHQQNVDLAALRKLKYCWLVGSNHYMEAEDDRGKSYEVEITKTSFRN